MTSAPPQPETPGASWQPETPVAPPQPETPGASWQPESPPWQPETPPWQPENPSWHSETPPWPPETAAGAPPAAPWPGYPYPPPARPDRVTRFVHRIWYGSPVWAAPAALLVCMAGAVAYTEVSHPTVAAAGDPPTCLLKYTTGFVCPGCGGTRAAWYLLHGDLPAAARHHAMFVIAVPFLLYLYVAWAGKRVFGWRLPQLDLSPKVIGIFLAAWGVWSVARNLPWAPFTSFYV